IQHALRAFTPRDQKAVRAAAETFRANPKIDVEQEIGQLGVGVALVSLLEDKGVPAMVQKTLIRPPSSRLGPITDQERGGLIYASPVREKYEQVVDRESAYEMLKARAAAAAQAAPPLPDRRYEPREEAPTPRRTGRTREGILESTAKSVLRNMGGQLGRTIMRGVLGNIFKGRR
nr:DUF853 family protein [Armatimonadota bacterium]